MTQKELSEILHDIGCPVNEGVSSLKNEKVFPRIDYWEIMWEDTMASGDDYENEITWQISFYARKPRNPKLIALKNRLNELGYTNAYIFSVEGWPHLDTVTPQLKAKGIKNVTLMPLMMVAGDHANNDMAGDEPDSFKSQLQAEGFKVNTYIHGLGENAAVQKLFVERANDSWNALKAK